MAEITVFEGAFRFLSNFFPQTIRVDVGFGRLTYPTVEHTYQAAKATCLMDHEEVRQLRRPGQAKKAGNHIDLRSDWEDVKEHVMLSALAAKFTVPRMRTLLLNTAPATLIEGNWWHDNEWGNCTCPQCRHIRGRNLLGRLLMDIRDVV